MNERTTILRFYHRRMIFLALNHLIPLFLMCCTTTQGDKNRQEQPSVTVNTPASTQKKEIDWSSRREASHKEIERLVKQSIKRCQMNEIWQCKAWLKAYQVMTYDLRLARKYAQSSFTRTQIWIELAMSLLSDQDVKTQTISAELLTIAVERLKFRFIPNLPALKTRVNEVISESDQPLQKSKLIKLLNHLLPLGKGESFYEFTNPQESIEVQITAWNILAQRHSEYEKIKFKKVHKVMKLNPSLSVKASLIKAVIPLRKSKVINWCGKEWWRSELYIPCRDAISSLDSERASYELWRWVKSIFEELDQTIGADIMIAEALTYLSPNVRSQRSQRRYRKLLDRFFKRRRSEKAAILLAQSWLKLPSNRYALETSLRYFRPKLANIAIQSYFFEQALKRIIYQLSNPLNIDK